MRVIAVYALVLMVLAAGCAKRDMDECWKGDRSRCPGDASRSSGQVKVSASGR